MQIILVEKYLYGREMLARLLKLDGYEVSIAKSAKHAISLLKETQGSIVLMNVFHCMYSAEVEPKLSIRRMELPNGHDKSAPADDETCHARSPLSNFPPLAGERANESLREFHINGHGKCAPADNETCHARFPLSNFPPQGERANESLREFHIKRALFVTCDSCNDGLDELEFSVRPCSDIALDIPSTIATDCDTNRILQLCSALRLSKHLSQTEDDFNWPYFSLLMQLPTNAYMDASISKSCG